MSSLGPKQHVFENLAGIAQALGHAHRLELLEHLGQGERSVEHLAERTGLTLANASRHLQRLRRAGLVVGRREGKRVYYRLAEEDAAVRLLQALSAFGERSSAEIARVIASYFRARVAHGIARSLALRCGDPHRRAPGGRVRARSPARRPQRAALSAGAAPRRAAARARGGRLLPRPLVRPLVRGRRRAAAPGLPGAAAGGRVSGMEGRRPAGRNRRNRVTSRKSSPRRLPYKAPIGWCLGGFCGGSRSPAWPLPAGRHPVMDDLGTSRIPRAQALPESDRRVRQRAQILELDAL